MCLPSRRKIGQAVTSALKIQLLGKVIVSDDKPPSGNVEAYQLVLQEHALSRRQPAPRHRAISASAQARPELAYAWGRLSNAWVNLGAVLTGDAQQQAFAQARVAADRQQALAPDAAVTHLDRGYLRVQVDNDPVGTLAEYQRAYALTPNDGTIMYFLAGGYANVGQLQPAVELFRKATATDPLGP